MILDDKLIKGLKTANLGLVPYFVLYCLANNLKWHTTIGEDRMSTFKTLQRRGLIDVHLQVTDKGLKTLAGNIVPKSSTKIVGIEEKVQKHALWFGEFWNTFPASDKYMHYPRTRTLRSNKMKAFKLYIDILREGEYTHEQILNALKADVHMKQKASIVQNQLRYLQTICTWLSKKIFEGFVEDVVEEGSVKPTLRYGEEFE